MRERKHQVEKMEGGHARSTTWQPIWSPCHRTPAERDVFKPPTDVEHQSLPHYKSYTQTRAGKGQWVRCLYTDIRNQPEDRTETKWRLREWIPSMFWTIPPRLGCTWLPACLWIDQASASERVTLNPDDFTAANHLLGPRSSTRNPSGGPPALVKYLNHSAEHFTIFWFYNFKLI